MYPRERRYSAPLILWKEVAIRSPGPFDPAHPHEGWKSNVGKIGIGSTIVNQRADGGLHGIVCTITILCRLAGNRQWGRRRFRHEKSARPLY